MQKKKSSKANGFGKKFLREENAKKKKPHSCRAKKNNLAHQMVPKKNNVQEQNELSTPTPLHLSSGASLMGNVHLPEGG